MVVLDNHNCMGCSLSSLISSIKEALEGAGFASHEVSPSMDTHCGPAVFSVSMALVLFC